MAIRLTKTSKVIFAISIVLLSSALGYLIWRVNQEENLDPDDSEAGATVPAGCSASATEALTSNCLIWFAEPGQTSACIANRSACCGNLVDVDNGCERCLCCNGTWVTGNTGCSTLCTNNGGYGSCEEVPVEKCFCESWSDACGTNCTFPDGVQAEVDAKAANSCKPYIAMCNVSTGDYVIEEYTPSHVCYNKVSQCNNPFAENPCVTNVCDAGAWVTRPTGNMSFTSDISYSATATDSNGIDLDSISVKLCTGTVTTCTTGQTLSPTKTGSSSPITISGVLSSAAQRLAAGTYTMTITWKDSLGVTGTNCTLTTTFTVLPQETNPNWDITKGVVGLCIDEGTENPKSELTYTITVRNTGDGAGTISKIEDVLDAKVLASFVQSGITAPGVFTDGKIIWSYPSPNELSIAAGATKTFTYKLVIDKDHFGTYANEVTLTPVGSTAIKATANILADCDVAQSDWTITKAVTEACIDEGTANPKSELSYTITVKNTGTGSGTIAKIEDVLDTKVLASFVQTGITSPGAFADGKITWNYATTPLSFTAGEQKIFTYKLIVDKDHFGTYANTVTLTPTVGTTKQATANIGADCTITEEEKPVVPETGIFDNTLGRISAGFVLVIFGVLVYNIPNGVLRINGEKKYKYRVRFEKKVANK